MAIPKPLGAGTFPDVAYYLGRWYVAWQNAASLHLVSLLPGTLEEVTWTSWNVGEPGVFPRLLSWNGRLFLAHRDAMVGYQIVLREIGSTRVERLDVEATPDPDLGHGSDPVALGEGYVAWQATGAPDYQVWRRPLLGSEQARLVREGRPTGLSRVLADGTVKTVDEDRDALTGYTRPSWAGDLTVAEGKNLGAYARLNDGRELVLWPGQEAVTPRCAWDGADRFGIATWSSREGVRFAEATRDEFLEPSTQPVEPVRDLVSVVDVLDYLPIGITLDGSHLLAFRVTGQQPNVFSVAKHEDGGGEWWAHDDQWVYHHMDQGGSPIEDVASGLFTPRFAPNGDRLDAYYFSPDARWMPRRAKTGDAWTARTTLHHVADGPTSQGTPWQLAQSMEVYRAWPTPFGPLPAIRQKSDPRTTREPNGRLRGGYEFWTFCRSEDKRIWYVTWEQRRTKDDNSGDERATGPDGQPLIRTFSRVFDRPITWRLSRRPSAAPLLPPATPDRNNMTITEPAADRFPLVAPGGRLRCVCAPDGGGWAPWIEWIYRRVGASGWTQQDERRRPQDDPDHTFRLPGNGEWEIGLRWQGGQTGRARVVRVEDVAAPPPPPPPTPPAPKTSTITLADWLVRCDPASGLLYADRREAGPDEQFEIHARGDQFAVLAVNRQQYVRAIAGGNGLLVADRARDEVDERFALAKNPETGARGIQVRIGSFWCAEGGGGREVVCDRRAIGGWETATISGLGGGPIAGGAGVPGPLRVAGRWFASPAGLFDYREASAFALYSLWLQKRFADIDAFLASVAPYATALRVLLTLDGDFWNGRGYHCGPDMPGFYDELRPFLAHCESRGFYVRLCLVGAVEPFGGVWFPDRRDIWTEDLDARVRAYIEQVMPRIADAPNVLIEMANEPGQIGLRSSFERVKGWGRLAKRLAPQLLMNFAAVDGPNDGDTSFVADPADFVDTHINRMKEYHSGDGWNGWLWVKRSSEHAVLDNEQKPAMSGETINFGSAGVGGSGDAERSPAIAFAYGATSRLRRYLTNFHFDDGLWCRPPNAETLACLDGWKRGLDAIPMDFGGGWCNGHHGCSPWETSNFPSSDEVRDHAGPVRIFGLSGSNGYIGASIREVVGHRPRARRPVEEIARVEWGGYACAVYRA